ncbi:MAG: hypothetical protein HY537_06965 [Deltaproteobacteria bacterium]|nr:hypothetical protein [Deltaproteobacteria bacterium]
MGWISIWVMIISQLSALSILHAAATRKASRVHLVELAVQGYAPFKDKLTSIDAGILKITEGDKTRCEILEPRASSVLSQKLWAPLDFYSNVVNETEEEIESRHGEPDIYFDGDDNNRNGSNDSHMKTLTPLQSFAKSLAFGKRTSTDKSSLSFPIQFKRGEIHFSGHLQVATSAGQGSCRTSAYLWLQTNPPGESKPRIRYELRKVIAYADLVGGTLDKILSWSPFSKKAPEADKKDIKKVEALVAEVDDQGRRGEPHYIQLAPQPSNGTACVD